MPRRRFLSPEFFKDEDLATLPYEARLLFQGLWCYADREGRLEDRPKYIKAELFPYDRVDMHKLLDLLANPSIPDRPTKVFIRRYTVDDRQLIDIPEFSKHQSPHKHEPDSILPVNVCTTTDIVRRTTDIVGASTDTCPSVIDIRERTKERGERREERGRKSTGKTSLPPDFTVSEAVKIWAKAKGFHRLEDHLEHFRDCATAKDYQYVDWDAAFKNAIRNNWAKLGAPSGHDPHSPLSKAGQETKANMERLVARFNATTKETDHDQT
jgi:hypothetical protein